MSNLEFMLKIDKDFSFAFCKLCGNVVKKRRTNIKRMRSCGCINKNPHRKETRKWTLMKYRCNSPNSSDYKNYGARGIRVCERWQSFENFFADMGPIPFKGASIERIDVNGDYCPENCKWITMAEQSQNRTITKFVTVNGGKLCLAEAARIYKINASTIRERLKRGWSEILAVTTPIYPACKKTTKSSGA